MQPHSPFFHWYQVSLCQLWSSPWLLFWSSPTWRTTGSIPLLRTPPPAAYQRTQRTYVHASMTLIMYIIQLCNKHSTRTVLVKMVSPCCMQLLVACGRWSDCSIPHTHGHHSGGTYHSVSTFSLYRSNVLCIPSVNMLYCSVLLCIKYSVRAFQPFSGARQCLHSPNHSRL